MMDAKRKLLSLAIATMVCACTFHHEKPSVVPATSETAQPATPSASDKIIPGPTPVEESSPQRGTGGKGTVVITPLEQPQVASPEAVPPTIPAPESGSAPESKSQTASPTSLPAGAPSGVPLPEVAAKPAAPPPPTTVVADNVPRDFRVTVGAKDPSHPYYGLGHSIGFIVNGVQGKELVLTRGVRYTFLVDTNVQHDFYFTTSPIGRGVGTVTDGIQGQFTYRGVVTFTPTASTPAVLYYECRNHPYMGGKIYIANAGDKVTIGGEAIERPAVPAKQTVVSEAEVKRKLNYAEMVINSSSSMKRVEASDIIQAKRLAAQAKELLSNAKSALAAGNNAMAMQAVNAALQQASAAIHLVPSQPEQVDYKARYSQMSDQLRSFDNAYEKNLARGMKAKSGQELDKAKFDQLIKEADGLAGQEQFEEAVKRLDRAYEMLTAALGALLQSQTVVYDKNFATPKEEYEYELSRYNSYADLIPLAIDQRKPSEQIISQMNALAARAKEIRDEGVGLADKGDHKQAILALQAATERLQRALRLAGVQ